EDGPTHQPVEHLSSLRLIPNLEVWRPCDKVETLAAWGAAIARRNGPTALVLTRQGVAHQARSEDQVADIVRGGYVLRDPTEGEPQALIMASGSEVGLAMAAAQSLEAEGLRVRVVSMPNPDFFEAQDPRYRDTVLPPDLTARVAVEAGVTRYWRPLVGERGVIIGIDHFGASAPAEQLFAEFGLTAEAVASAARELIEAG
ncbi:MAG: transketolase-like TK C-terminal-containing protein, partial [Wenzhouxiangella sp.]